MKTLSRVSQTMKTMGHAEGKKIQRKKNGSILTFGNMLSLICLAFSDLEEDGETSQVASVWLLTTLGLETWILLISSDFLQSTIQPH